MLTVMSTSWSADCSASGSDVNPRIIPGGPAAVLRQQRRRAHSGSRGHCDSHAESPVFWGVDQHGGVLYVRIGTRWLLAEMQRLRGPADSRNRTGYEIAPPVQLSRLSFGALLLTNRFRKGLRVRRQKFSSLSAIMPPPTFDII